MKATDLNGDVLTYELVQKPQGMAIANNGTLTWRPSQDQVGIHQVIVRVSDGKGGIDLQTFNVDAKQGNRAPVITSIAPEINPQVNKAFKFQATATDLDGDALTYELVSNPEIGRAHV